MQTTYVEKTSSIQQMGANTVKIIASNNKKKVKISRSEWIKIGESAGWWQNVQQGLQNVQRGLQRGQGVAKDVVDALPYDPNADVFDPHLNPNIDPETGFRKKDTRNQKSDQNGDSDQTGSPNPYQSYDQTDQINEGDKIEFTWYGEERKGVVRDASDKSSAQVQFDNGEFKSFDLTNPQMKVKKVKNPTKNPS